VALNFVKNTWKKKFEYLRAGHQRYSLKKKAKIRDLKFSSGKK